MPTFNRARFIIPLAVRNFLRQDYPNLELIVLDDGSDPAGACVLELPGGAFWTTGPQLHRRMFVGDVHGGTLVYRRELLSSGLRYPELNLAEDAWLLHYAVSRGGRLLRLPNPGLFVYVRQGRNAWSEFAHGRFIDSDGWGAIAPPHGFTREHLALYRTAAAAHAPI